MKSLILSMSFLSISAYAGVECSWVAQTSEAQKLEIKTTGFFGNGFEGAKTYQDGEELISLTRRKSLDANDRQFFETEEKGQEFIRKYGTKNLYAFYNSEDVVLIALSTRKPAKSEIISNFYSGSTLYTVGAVCKKTK